MTFRAWVIDTTERAVFTFVESFLGLLMIGQSGMIDSISPSIWQNAAASGLIAALAVVKGAVASRRDGISPASVVSGSSEG
jgi:hypothetical protein